jgi:hypothetical protein
MRSSNPLDALLAALACGDDEAGVWAKQLLAHGEAASSTSTAAAKQRVREKGKSEGPEERDALRP